VGNSDIFASTPFNLVSKIKLGSALITAADSSRNRLIIGKVNSPMLLLDFDPNRQPRKREIRRNGAPRE
jgi:hypothetical protein